MDSGVPRERRQYDSRVGLTPAGVELLTAEGHTCFVDLGAGLGAGFSEIGIGIAKGSWGYYVIADFGGR